MRIKSNFKVLSVYKLVILFSLITTSLSCNNEKKKIVISAYKQTNALIKKIDIHTPKEMEVSLLYWNANDEDTVMISDSNRSFNHHFTLIGLKPRTTYTYRIVSTFEDQIVKTERQFKTKNLPIFIHDQAQVTQYDTTGIPAQFREGYIMIYKSEIPGVLLIINTKGEVVWYKESDSSGFKVATYTADKNILALTASKGHKWSFSNEAVESSLKNDTFFDLKKQKAQLPKISHHEILLNNMEQIVTLTKEEKVFDLSSRGGAKQDTVIGDGLIVMNKQGKTLWHWFVFDTLNPLSFPDILNKKNDLVHANSICFDKDGNYIVSFYNLGQIWKISAKTGAVLWKFGKGGDFKINTQRNWFNESHAVQMVDTNKILLFDNGGKSSISRILTYKINEKSKTASLIEEVFLPENLHTSFMGSAYHITDSTYLVCCGMAGQVVLINNKEKILWKLRTNFRPYRAVFIPHKDLNF